ncbi:MAG TPA: hypothetical protein VHE35_16795 [Kofleriaceae bacterium]|nr:hypothetical protein [Kofleriaceae bacterium]
MRTALRTLPSLAAISTVSALLVAACGSSPKHATTANTANTPNTTKPPGGGGATIALSAARSTDDDPDAWMLDDHGALPAISDDGTEVAALFHDHVDFVGTPVDTVLVWRIADGKEVARVRVTADNPDTPVTEAQATGAAAQATRALADHRWLTAAGSATTTDDDDGASVRLADGRTLRLDPDRQVIAMDGARLSPDHFPAPGTGQSDEGQGEADCGEVTGLTVLAGGRQGDDWILLAPRVNLGGDNCFGALGADLAQLVRIGR